VPGRQRAGLQGPDEQALQGLADALARHLDGSDLLAAQPHRAAAIALRLRVKWHDAVWWRRRQPQDPWDAGWALATAAGLARLQDGFAPRRATLILADGRQADTLNAALQALAARCGGLHQPVRWLWVGGEGALPPAPGQALAIFRQDPPHGLSQGHQTPLPLSPAAPAGSPARKPPASWPPRR